MIRELRPDLDAAYARVMDSGRFLLGPELEQFETEFAAACDVRHCIGVASGLDALQLSLRVLDIGPGDEVLVPAHTFIATFLAVSQVGARPVPVDVSPRGFNLDPERLEAACTPRTRAIIPVHLYGEPADMPAIQHFAARRGLHVLEDAAQAHGARVAGRIVGGWGGLAAFSFYPGKNLGAFGDGGAVTTNDARLAERLRALRNYGGVRKYEHLELGFNSRLGELQAAFLRVRLACLPEWNQRRRKRAVAYASALTGLAELDCPTPSPATDPVWHLYVVCHPHRDCLRHWLQQRGIDTLVHYPLPPHRTPAYAGLNPLDFPRAQQLAETVVSLPMGPHLSPDELRRVADAVAEFCAGHAAHSQGFCRALAKAAVPHHA
jgi:dTDP-3-amino-3,4,6-trideoxy-alpha-D-glucose transaminase